MAQHAFYVMCVLICFGILLVTTDVNEAEKKIRDEHDHHNTTDVIDRHVLSAKWFLWPFFLDEKLWQEGSVERLCRISCGNIEHSCPYLKHRSCLLIISALISHRTHPYV